ncbi:uncharacterized protein F5Z01DRAFT_672261 [Emericellopsis atlantica]|uniref:Uncharacterized protein n=1 Tax=Emericellopsis atlantica TaxID=2614577 RepID=A0A9P7ZR18_9HYPO|nr:uncharacterized protein F5Z01DRAFT_672261 [Emericellopsis atlantica]KAG9256266.1 hypothetical protein F5Z01DRAFT_672261 [Emericellopsis atlantica]
MKVAIIGGGPSGLATLRFLLHAHEFFPIDPIEVRLFEGDKTIGGTFVQRVYEDAELVSSKYLTAFSDYRLPRKSGDFVTPKEYVNFLNSYVRHHRLDRSIELETKVMSVSRSVQGGHKVEIRRPDGSTEEWVSDAVAVCTGLNMNPRIPDMKNLDKIPEVLHSSQIKNRRQFGSGAKVVVMGAGEAAMDMAHLAVTSGAKSVYLCHRAGFFCAPKVIPVPIPYGKGAAAYMYNKPVDASVASLFNTAYVHPVLQRSSLLWTAYDQWIKKMHMLISGTEEGPDQWVGHMSKERKHVNSVFFVKSDRAIRYMSEGHRSESWWNKKRTAFLNVPLKPTFGRKIHVCAWPEEIDNEGCMALKNESDADPKRVKPDLVLMATGYQTEFPFFDASYPSITDTDVRAVYNSDNIDVGFIGFVRPSIGAIPPLAELQAQFWILRLLQDQFPDKMPTGPSNDALAGYEMDWQLKARAGYDLFASKRGVDHESYAYQLALDMGAAPNIGFVMRKGWKILFTWAMGSNFNPKFRLVGPWKSEAVALQIMEKELYPVVKMSGGAVYLLTYTVIPFVCFGLLSLFLYACSMIAKPFATVGNLFAKKKNK